jgi:hypothetical protein
MDQAPQLNWLTNFIWNIADDDRCPARCLPVVKKPVPYAGKYRDVILPMTVADDVLRRARLDAPCWSRPSRPCWR